MILPNEIRQLGGFRGVKQKLNIEMKLTTVNIFITDYKFIKQLVLQGIVANISELIRSAVMYYVFFEQIMILDDRNWDHTRGNNGPKKCQIPVHFPKGLKEMVKKKYAIKQEEFNFGGHIRQFVHLYIQKIRENSGWIKQRENN